MFEWFKNLDPVVQAAFIGGCATIIGVIITGMFSLVKKSKGAQSSTNINQKQGICNKGTQMGVQNITTNLDDISVEDGAIIIASKNGYKNNSIRNGDILNNSELGGKNIE